MKFMIFDIRMFDVNKNIIVNESVGYESILKHSHAFTEIVFVRNGTALHQIANCSVEIKKGDLFIIETDDVHSIRPLGDSEKFKITNVIVSKDLLKTPSGISPLRVFNMDKMMYEYQIDRIEKEYLSEKSNEEILLLLVNNLFNSVKIETLLTEKVKPFAKKHMVADIYIDNAIEYVKTHYQSKITLKDIADAVGVYPSYLQKLFHENRSTSVMRFVQRYRLEKSCQLLIESELSIDEICNAVGVGDLKNYYSYFKRYFNVTPQAFRITHRSKKNKKDGEDKE